MTSTAPFPVLLQLVDSADSRDHLREIMRSAPRRQIVEAAMFLSVSPFVIEKAMNERYTARIRA